MLAMGYYMARGYANYVTHAMANVAYFEDKWRTAETEFTKYILERQGGSHDRTIN